MITKKGILLIVILVFVIIAGIMAVMILSYQHGKDQDTVVQTSVAREETDIINAEEKSESSHLSNDEAFGKITGEDDDFTLVADPANYDVTIIGFEGNITLLTSKEEVLHQQMKAWMDENEFWDMTEVVYTGKYLRDETNNLTKLYFKIIRYPDSPLLATWNSTTAQYEFAIEWN